ncbi:MAG: hypothetical protein QMD80_02640 [archaeon]|nr:hypothetical protein [archaeon]
MMIIVLICIAVTGTSFVKTLRQVKLGTTKIYFFTTLVGLILMIFGLILIAKEVFFTGEFVTWEALLGQTAFSVGLILSLFAHLNSRIDKLYEK